MTGLYTRPVTHWLRRRESLEMLGREKGLAEGKEAQRNVSVKTNGDLW
jgi:hypothetical protein